MHCRNTPGIVLSSLKEKSTGDPNMFKPPGFRKQDKKKPTNSNQMEEYKH